MARRLTGGLANEIRPPAGHNNVLLLTGAGAEKTITVPSGYSVALLNYTMNEVNVEVNATAATPGADIVDGTGPDLSPTGYSHLKAGDVLHFQSPNTGKVWIGFYATDPPVS